MKSKQCLLFWAGTSGGGIWKYSLSDLNISYTADTNEYISVGPVIADSNSVSVFPVPAKDHVNFDVHLISSSTATLYIFNSIGQLLLHYPLQGASHLEINASEIGSDGLYLYKVITGNELFEGKFIIHR